MLAASTVSRVAQRPGMQVLVKGRQGRVMVVASSAAPAAPAAPAPVQAAPAGWACASSSQPSARYSISVLGDLHLEPAQMPLFHEAREQLLAAMSGAGAAAPHPGARVVQLGDLGGYKHQPGSRECFRVASEYLTVFGVPVALITGNHDLEGEEFEEDAANLAAWQLAFRQHHHWALPLGPVLAVGLSTVRFRSNTHSAHEVYVDDEQMAWFEGVLAAHRDTPVVAFTHAPPVGSGLKVVQNVHVKNRCAWLNHSDRPQRFIQLVEANPNIKLWFSGHFHLSQNYVDSISVVGSCAFVQTGVIGECNRDGSRQSRLLRFDRDGYELFTVDHVDGGSLRCDLRHSWASRDSPQPIVPDHKLACDPDAGWLCSQLDCNLPQDAAAAAAASTAQQPQNGASSSGQPQRVQWLPAGRNCMLAVQDGMVVEFDMALRSAVGLVAFLEPGQAVSLVSESGGPPQADDGSDAVAVVISGPAPGALQRLERNGAGTFYRVFQANKWRARKAAEAEAAAAAAVAAKSTSTADVPVAVR